MSPMPRNTAEFARAFQKYLDCFVIIGGTPTKLYVEQRRGHGVGITQDLDVVILDVENDRGTEFLTEFVDYVERCGYSCASLGSAKPQAYRFTGPNEPLAPKIIEIATRRQEGLPLKQVAQRIEDFDLSAMVCEPYFIEMLKIHKERFPVEANQLLPVALPSVLILLKSYAVVNFEKQGDRSKRNKHLRDIAWIASVLTEDDKLQAPKEAYQHLETILKKANTYFAEDRLRDCGWKGKKTEDVVSIIQETIELK